MGRISNKTKEIISVLLVAAIVIAAISGIVVYSARTHRTVSSTVFSRGALDSNGKHLESDTCLYTEELIQCRGLLVEVDFEAKLEYEIFFYRADESFIGSTGRLVEDFTLEGYDNAKYCRIVITPELKDGADKIRFWEILSYADQITVKVAIDQEFEPVYSSLFPGVTDDHFASETDYEMAYTVRLEESPFVMSNISAVAGRTINRIGVPVSLIKDPTQDNTFTVYVVEGNGSAAFKQVKELKLIIPAGTFTGLEQVTTKSDSEYPPAGEYRKCFLGWYKVQQWVYFDVDIILAANQTLAFGNSSDTVAFGYEKAASGDLPDGWLYNNVWKTPVLNKNLGMWFDLVAMD